ncbi:hypothetical protein [Litoreibacter albidus]|uniref:hypothetical protein n=1 Tax=Litoreibacter albidus TaxID=670155 RepID=UPI00373661BB
MAGALTLFFLLAVSLTIVRTAGVALRLSGVPQSVARFQAISALTGAGFTTNEAEPLMRHPVRRRILMVLMLAGHVGLVSIASTVILSVAASDGTSGTVTQVVALILSVLAVCALATSPRLDRIMCALIGRVMVRLNLLAPGQMAPIYIAADGAELIEHTIHNDLELNAATLPVRILSGCDIDPVDPDTILLCRDDVVLCFGQPEDHQVFAYMLQSGQT